MAAAPGTIAPNDYDSNADKRHAPKPDTLAPHDNLGVHPEHREAEIDDLERAAAPSAADPSGSNAADAQSLGDQESAAADDAVGRGYTGSDDSTGTKKGRRKGGKGGVGKIASAFNIKHHLKRRLAVATTAAVVGIAGFSLLAGVAQPIHYGEILKRPGQAHQLTLGRRFTQLMLSYASGRVRDTHMVSFQGQVLSWMKKGLAKQGVTLQQDANTGRLRVVKVDLSKYPEYQEQSPAEAAASFARDNGISVDKARQISGLGAGKIGVNLTDLDSSSLNSLLGNLVYKENTNKIISFYQFRVLKRAMGDASWLHPFQKSLQKTSDKLSAHLRAAAKQSENARLKKLVAKSDQIKAFNKGIRDKNSGALKAAGAVLVATQAVCTVKEVLQDVPIINRLNVAVPAMLSAGDALAEESQIQAGQGSLLDVEAVAGNYTDPKTGTTPFDGEAVNKLADPTANTGVPVDSAVKQAFSPDSNAKSLTQTLDDYGAGALCSGTGQLLQGVAGGVLLLTGAGTVLEKAVQVGVGFGVQQALSALTHSLSSLLADKPLQLVAHQGAAGGNFDALGSVALFNMQAMSQGGAVLSASQTAQLTAAQSTADPASFDHESLASRIFDIRDYRSLAGQLADKVSPNSATNIASIFSFTATSLAHLGSMFTSLSSALLPHTHAEPASNGWFNLGSDIREYDFSLADMNSYVGEQDAGDSDAAVVNIVGNGGDYNGYQSRVTTCFGEQFYQDENGRLGVEQATVIDDGTDSYGPNPTSSSYAEANCNDRSTNWLRIRFFIFDTTSMDAFGCSQNDATACSVTGASL